MNLDFVMKGMSDNNKDNMIIGLINCLSDQRIADDVMYNNLIVCIFNIFAGHDKGVEMLHELSDDIAFTDRVWNELKRIGVDNTVTFDIDTLHGWASADDPALYAELSQLEAVELDQS